MSLSHPRPSCSSWPLAMALALAACQGGDPPPARSEATPATPATPATAATMAPPPSSPTPRLNHLRNPGFERAAGFNGGPGLRAEEVAMARDKALTRLPAEGWWCDSAQGAGLSREVRHGGACALELRAPADRRLRALSAPSAPLPAGPVVLSAWVRTSGARGSLHLQPLAQGDAGVAVALPAEGGWTQLAVVRRSATAAAVRAVIELEAGTAWVDDLQLEAGSEPGAAEPPPAERCRLAFAGVEEERLPVWRADGLGRRTLELANDGPGDLAGDLELRLMRWDRSGERVLATRSGLRLAAGSTCTLEVDLAGLEAQAYVVCASLRQDGKALIDGAASVDPAQRLGGRAQPAMLRSRCALRFAVAPVADPRRLLGVGNSMLAYGWDGCSGDWYSGWPLALYHQARPEAFVCTRNQTWNEEVAYLLAAGGLVTHRMIDTAFGGADVADLTGHLNPAARNGLDLSDAEGWKAFLARAEQEGRTNGATPQIVSCQIANETVFPFKDGICPTRAADESFRAFCRTAHGDLATLNRRWGTRYAGWEEVEQPVAAGLVATAADRAQQQGAAAIDWLASMGGITPEIQKRITAVPGRGMDWCRWRTAGALRAYAAYREAARVHSPGVLYGGNLCWPNFWPQMSMPFFRAMDASMLDVQYTAGMPRTLGTPAEMLDVLEMAESNAPDRPLWGIEVYLQPSNHPAFVALQNWAMLAHGMSNIMAFAWGPYSDHGIPKTARAWEAADAKPMWLMIDKDGTRLPHYHETRRSAQEIAAFHRDHDALDLGRAPTTVAIYRPSDAGEYLTYATGNKPYASPWTRAVSDLVYLLRQCGVAADHLDDQTLAERLDRYRQVVVPASMVLAQEPARRLAGFVQAGGTLVLAGPVGLADPWLNRHDTLGGPAWAALGWRAPGATEAKCAVRFADPAPGDKAELFRGGEPGACAGGAPIRDADGRAVGWTKAWGAGRVVASAVFPSVYSSNPHAPASALAWARLLVEQAGLPVAARWEDAPSTAPASAGSHGTGAPVVEVVVRARRAAPAGERFVFVLNQGGAGEGVVSIAAAAPVAVSDAISGKALPTVPAASGRIAIPLPLKAWDYRVLRLAPAP